MGGVGTRKIRSGKKSQIDIGNGKSAIEEF
jgi:hypothetical protein